METRIEYGLINKLPDGCDIDDVSAETKWLYDTPFRVREVGSKALGEIWVNELTKDAEDLNRRRRLIDNGVKPSELEDMWIAPGTVAVVCKRTVTYGDWEEVTE
ncbi:MAG TPA: hypothetical protein VIY48_14090 [Candidatus Paceibacterota bacterium]